MWGWRLGLCVCGLLVVLSAHADGPRNAKELAFLAQVQKGYADHNVTLTPALEAQALQSFRKAEGTAIQIQAMAAVEGHVAPVANPMAANDDSDRPGAVASRADLTRMVRDRESTMAATTFERRQDGFVADGHLVVDAAGRISTFGGDAATGDVTYFVDQGQGHYLVRFANIHSALSPVTIGHLIANDGYRFMSIDGEQIAGEQIIPAGNGVVVARQGTLFSDTFGKGIDTQSLPAGYLLAPLQHGDVAGTGYVLLRRAITESERTDAIQGLSQLFKSVTGHSDDKDYALFNVHTGNTVYLNRSESTDRVGQGSDCHAKNRLVSICRGWESYDALFEPSGLINPGHYYWGVQWLATAQGPTAVVVENGAREVNVIRLDTGTRVNAFKRALGITSFTVQPTSDGSLSVTGNWMFRAHVVRVC